MQLVAAKAIPVLISALAKHVFDNKNLASSAQRECLSYHESFAVVKGVLEDAMSYTIEEIQVRGCLGYMRRPGE